MPLDTQTPVLILILIHTTMAIPSSKEEEPDLGLARTQHEAIPIHV